MPDLTRLLEAAAQGDASAADQVLPLVYDELRRLAACYLQGEKAGQTLQIQAYNDQRQPLSFLLPLADFAKAHDGPPTDPKVLEEQRKEQQKKMQDELLKQGNQDVTSVRAKNSGHGKKTADKWNQ